MGKPNRKGKKAHRRRRPHEKTSPEMRDAMDRALRRLMSQSRDIAEVVYKLRCRWEPSSRATWGVPTLDIWVVPHPARPIESPQSTSERRSDVGRRANDAPARA